MYKKVLITIILAVSLSACNGTPTLNATEVPNTATEAVSVEQAVTESPTYAPITLKINQSPLISQAPIFIADAEGYFAEQGITMEYVTFNRSDEALPLLITGDLDIYAGSINAGLINALGQDDSIKVVADRGHVAPTDSCTFQAILVRKDLFESGQITSAADLKGQTIASSKAGPTGFLLSTYLAKADLTFDDVEISNLPTSAYIDAFTNKTISVIVAPELYITKLLQAGNAVILAKGQEELGTMQTSVLAYGKNLLTDNPDAGLRFMTAYLKGVAKYNEGKTAENVEQLSKAMDETAGILGAACWLSINADGMIDFPGIDAFQNWSVAQGDLDKTVTEDQFWNPYFVKQAFQQVK